MREDLINLPQSEKNEIANIVRFDMTVREVYVMAQSLIRKSLNADVKFTERDYMFDNVIQWRWRNIYKSAKEAVVQTRAHYKPVNWRLAPQPNLP